MELAILEALPAKFRDTTHKQVRELTKTEIVESRASSAQRCFTGKDVLCQGIDTAYLWWKVKYFHSKMARYYLQCY